MGTPIYGKLCIDLGRDPLCPANNCYLQVAGLWQLLTEMLSIA